MFEDGWRSRSEGTTGEQQMLLDEHRWGEVLKKGWGGGGGGCERRRKDGPDNELSHLDKSQIVRLGNELHSQEL